MVGMGGGEGGLCFQSVSHERRRSNTFVSRVFLPYLPEMNTYTSIGFMVIFETLQNQVNQPIQNSSDRRYKVITVHSTDGSLTLSLRLYVVLIKK